MSAELVMAGAGQPITHITRHDLESLFYVLLGICVLYDEPFKPKSEDRLARCFDVYFNTFEPSLLKTIMIQSNVGWVANILKHISPYFRPLIPLLDVLREKIVMPMMVVDDSLLPGGEPITSNVMVNCIIKALSELPAWCWVTRDPPDKDECTVDQRPTPATSSSASVPPLDNVSSPNSESAAHSSEEDTSSCSESAGTGRMLRPSAIRQVTGPGFTTLATSSSSGSSRRPPPESDTEYIESNHRQKRPRFQFNTAIQTRRGLLASHRFAATEPTSDLRSAGSSN